MRPELVGFLREDVPDGTRVMLAVRDRRVEIVVPFTTDREAVVAALVEESRRAGYGQLFDAQRLALQGMFAGLGGQSTGRSGRTLSQQSVDAATAEAWLEASLLSLDHELDANARRSWRLLQALVDSMAALPGRKVLVYVSDGVPGQGTTRRPAVFISRGRTVVDNMPTAADSLRPELKELIAHANTLGVTVHTVYSSIRTLKTSPTSLSGGREPLSPTTFLGNHGCVAPAPGARQNGRRLRLQDRVRDCSPA